MQYGILQIKNNSSNVTIQGSGTIDGNYQWPASWFGTQFPNFCCLGGVVAGGPILGDYQTNISNVTISGIKIINIPQWPISIDGTDGVTLKDLTIHGGGNSVQFAHGTKNAHAYNLHIDHIRDMGFAFYNNISNSSISDSTVTDTLGAGIAVFTDQAGGVTDTMHNGPSHDITIENNTVFKNLGWEGAQSGYGIWVETSLESGVSPSVTFSKYGAYGISIRGNSVSQNTSGGILLSPCTNCSVTGNSIHNDGPSTSISPDYTSNVTAGVRIASSNHVTVSNNIIRDEGGVSPLLSPGLGVSVESYLGTSDSQGISVTGNTIEDDQSQPTMRQAFAGGSKYYQVTTSGNSVHGSYKTLPTGDFSGDESLRQLSAAVANAGGSTVDQQQKPRGYVFGADCSTVTGWAQDQDTPDTPIDVHFYVDGQFAGSMTAGAKRDDLCSYIGSCYHYFSWSIPTQFKTSGVHVVSVFGIDSANIGTNNVQLPPTPAYFTCN